MPNSLIEHVQYTENEWVNTPYFIDVIDFLEDRKIKSMIDVGGCTGEVSRIFLEKIPTLESIIILEPVLENYNFILNRFKDNNKIRVINSALYYGKDSISLGQIDGNVGGWGVDLLGNAIDNVSTITLEELPIVDFIKIDIEGAESNVISNSITLQEIPCIEIEFHFELMSTWEDYVAEYLPNHKIIFNRFQNVLLCKS